MRSALAGPLVLFVICCGFCWKLVLSNQYTWIDNHDIVNMDVPRLQFQRATWHNHEFPLWDPHLWCGQPFLGQIVGAAYPLNWPFFLLKPNARGQLSLGQLNWYFLSLHFLGALFAYWLCRDLGISRTASVFGGFVFSFGGYFGVTLWPEVLSGLLLAPLVFLFLIRALRRDRPASSAALAGMFLGLCWLSGHHEIPIYLSLAVAAIWFYDLLVSRADWMRSLALSCVTVLFAILTSGFQTVPGYEYAKLAFRWVGTEDPVTWNDTIPYQIHAQYSFPPASLIAVVVPWGGQNAGAFIGVVVLSLAAIAVFTSWQDRWVRLCTCIAIGGGLLALGGRNVFHGILYSVVPILEKARNPDRIVFLFGLCASILAAFGLDRLRLDPLLPITRNLSRVLIALAGFIFAVGLVAFALQKPGPNDLVFMLGLISVLLAAGLFAWRNRSISSRTLSLAVLALAFIELGNVSGSIYWPRQTDHHNDWLPNLTQFRDIVDFLRHQPGPIRVSAADATGAFNLGDWEGIDALSGFGAGVTRNVFSLDWLSVQTQNLLAVGYSLSTQPPRPDQQLVFRGSNGVNVLKNLNALPRAWIVHRIDQAPSFAVLRARVDDASFDTRNTALMLNAPPALHFCTGDEQAHILWHSANTVVIDARLDCRGMLILADTWYPGWIATVDGGRVPIYEVFSALRGVVMDRGQHRLEFRYRPASALIGAIFSASGILGACAAALWDRNRSCRGSGVDRNT
jgi:hypothetical protein